jgi:RNA polymerase sigma-70 factor (ECF subfamily)
MGSSSKNDLSTEELFRVFAPFVARFLYRLGVGSEGLDDVVQEVFLVVHRRGGYKAGPAKPTSYLATIAAHAASAYRRRRRVEQARASDAEVEGLVSNNKGPVQILEVSERLHLLQAALDRLDPDFRSALVLADIEGVSCASIAASFGVPTGTVYWRLHEARKRFKRALKAEMAGIPARSLAPDEALASGREHRSALAFAVNPLWWFSDARRLLRDGATQVPVHYDVGSGLAKHRELAGTTATASHAPAVASVAAHTSAGMGILGAGAAGIAAIAAIGAAVAVRSAPPSGVVTLTASPGSTRAVSAEAPPGAASADTLPITGGGSGAASAPSTAEAARSAFVVRSETAKPSIGKVASSNGVRTATGSASPASEPAKQAATEPAKPSIAEPAKPAPEASKPAPAEPSKPVAATSAAASTRAEAQEIARAERLLSSDPAGALAIVRRARAQSGASFLAEERDYVEVMALAALGRSDEARILANRFLNAYPGGAFGKRVSRVIGK